MIRRILRSAINRIVHLTPREIRQLGVQFGEDCRFIASSRATFGSEPYLIRMGHHVTVGENVRFLTHDGGIWVARDQHPQIDIIAPISVGDNVFIGSHAIILPGVSIGSNSVIGAGSVVTKDVVAGSVSAGIPARKIRDVEQYVSSALQNPLNTKGLGAAEKKAALVAHYFKADRK